MSYFFSFLILFSFAFFYTFARVLSPLFPSHLLAATGHPRYPPQNPADTENGWGRGTHDGQTRSLRG
jgi:hypothetical protein